MSNFLLKSPDCVFIHIPKTGGSSVRHGVWSSEYDGPIFGKIPAEWDHLFKFTFVRHPCDRLVSAWLDFRQLRGYEGTIEQFMDVVEDDRIIYDERRSNTKERIRHHTIPQTHPFNCLTAADFIGRFERFSEDLTHVTAVLNKVALDIPHRRKTKRGQWREYLSDDMIARVADFYEADFVQLDYEPR